LLQKGAKFSDDMYNRSELHYAAESGKVEFLEYLIEVLRKKGILKIEINKQDKYKNNLLHYAAKSGNKECIQNSISKSIFTKNKYDETPLHFIASLKKDKVDNEKYKEALNFLIDEITPIIDIQEELSRVNRRGETPLHLAAIHGNVECIKILTNQGVDVNNQNNINGSTALHLAVINGHLDCVKLLLKLGATSIKLENGRTLVHLAAEYGHKNCLEFLVNEFPSDIHEVDNIGNTPLHLAFSDLASNKAQTNQECIGLLIDKDVEINKKNEEGDTPLHLAAQSSNKECLKLLIEKMQSKDIDIHEEIFYTNNNGETVIHMAAFGGNIECLEYLIKQHCSKKSRQSILNQNNNDGEILLHLAALSGSTECVQYLIKTTKDAGMNIKAALLGLNNNRENLLHLAALSGNKECIELIIQEAENAEVKMKKYYLHEDSEENGLFHKAALGGNEECFKLITHKIEEITRIDVNDLIMINDRVIKANNSNNITPLHLATACLHVDLVQHLTDILEKVEDDFRKQINSKDNSGRTPLHYAVMSDSQLGYEESEYTILEKRQQNQHLKKKAIKSLLYVIKESGERIVNNKIDFDIKDNNGKTVLDYVLIDPDITIMQLFLNAFSERKKTLEQEYQILEKKYQKSHKWISRINSVLSSISGIIVTSLIPSGLGSSPEKTWASIVAIFCSCVAILLVFFSCHLESKENKLKDKIQNYSEKIKQIEDRISGITGKGKEGYRTARERDELIDKLLDIHLPNTKRKDRGNDQGNTDNKNTKQESTEGNRRKSVNKCYRIAKTSEGEKTSNRLSSKHVSGKRVLRRQEALSIPNTPRTSIVSAIANTIGDVQKTVEQSIKVRTDCFRPRAHSYYKEDPQKVTIFYPPSTKVQVPEIILTSPEKDSEDYRSRTRSDLYHIAEE
jgi:ankyrin repeat protein